ncbi:hypothetical protein Esti_001445 [Eimeria stiedai]
MFQRAADAAAQHAAAPTTRCAGAAAIQEAGSCLPASRASAKPLTIESARGAPAAAAAGVSAAAVRAAFARLPRWSVFSAGTCKGLSVALAKAHRLRQAAAAARQAAAEGGAAAAESRRTPKAAGARTAAVGSVARGRAAAATGATARTQAKGQQQFVQLQQRQGKQQHPDSSSSRLGFQRRSHSLSFNSGCSSIRSDQGLRSKRFSFTGSWGAQKLLCSHSRHRLQQQQQQQGQQPQDLLREPQQQQQQQREGLQVLQADLGGPCLGVLHAHNKEGLNFRSPSGLRVESSPANEGLATQGHGSHSDQKKQRWQQQQQQQQQRAGQRQQSQQEGSINRKSNRSKRGEGAFSRGGRASSREKGDDEDAKGGLPPTWGDRRPLLLRGTAPSLSFSPRRICKCGAPASADSHLAQRAALARFQPPVASFGIKVSSIVRGLWQSQGRRPAAAARFPYSAVASLALSSSSTSYTGYFSNPLLGRSSSKYSKFKGTAAIYSSSSTESCSSSNDKGSSSSSKTVYRCGDLAHCTTRSGGLLHGSTMCSSNNYSSSRSRSRSNGKDEASLKPLMLLETRAAGQFVANNTKKLCINSVQQLTNLHAAAAAAKPQTSVPPAFCCRLEKASLRLSQSQALRRRGAPLDPLPASPMLPAARGKAYSLPGRGHFLGVSSSLPAAALTRGGVLSSPSAAERRHSFAQQHHQPAASA